MVESWRWSCRKSTSTMLPLPPAEVPPNIIFWSEIFLWNILKYFLLSLTLPLSSNQEADRRPRHPPSSVLGRQHDTNMSPTWHQHVTNMSPTWHQHVTNMSPTCHQHVTNMAATWHVTNMTCHQHDVSPVFTSPAGHQSCLSPSPCFPCGRHCDKVHQIETCKFRIALRFEGEFSKSLTDLFYSFNRNKI